MNTTLCMATVLACLGQDAVKNPIVELDTSLGKVVVELYADKAPATVKNFLSYVEKQHYDGTIFHRVIPRFMIQGGGFDASMSQRKTDSPVKNEAKNGLKNLRGTVAMARTNAVDSATSQFFINHGDNEFLNHKSDREYGYAVFGRVIEGMDVVDKVAAVRTTTRAGHDDVPVEVIEIKTARLRK